MRARTAILVATGVLAACSFDSSGVASAGASGVQEGGESTTQTSSHDETTSTSDGSGSASGTATTMPGTTIDPTTSPVDTGADTSESTIDPSNGTSTGGPESAHLQHGTHATCNEPMWCTLDGNVWNPAGGPHAGAECFDSPFATSQITGIEYDVAAVAAELTTFSLEVYTANNGRPGQLIQSLPMNAADAAVGPHHVAIVPPIGLVDAHFCVGFRTLGLGLDGALGIASSEDSQTPNESWLTTDDCSLYYWTDVIGTVAPPSGNWCISVELESTE